MQKEAPVSSDFYVHYLYPKWGWTSAPPIRHGDGTTLSMADGHVEYWKWKGRETIKMPRELWPAGSIFLDLLEDDYEPKTEDVKRGKNVTFYVQDGTYIWFC